MAGDTPLVLVVDDEVAFRELVAQILRDEGWRVETAADGKQALESMRRERPALLLLDLMMPVLSGQDLLAAMARSHALATVPVLVLTGVLEPQLDRRSARVVGVMHKPVVLHALVSKVAGVLRAPGDAPP